MTLLAVSFGDEVPPTRHRKRVGGTVLRPSQAVRSGDCLLELRAGGDREARGEGVDTGGVVVRLRGDLHAEGAGDDVDEVAGDEVTGRALPLTAPQEAVGEVDE